MADPQSHGSCAWRVAPELVAAAKLLGPGPAPELLAPADEEAPADLSAAACAVARLAIFLSQDWTCPRGPTRRQGLLGLNSSEHARHCSQTPLSPSAPLPQLK